MNKIKNLIEIIFDNRIINKLFIIISTINLIRSFSLIRKQHKILKTVINENDEFFTALGLMGFVGGNFYNLVSIHEVDVELTDEEIYSIANKNIIATVKNFIENEMLLGVIKIEVDKIPGRKIKFNINTAAYRLFLADLYDFTISFGIFILITIITLIFM